MSKKSIDLHELSYELETPTPDVTRISHKDLQTLIEKFRVKSTRHMSHIERVRFNRLLYKFAKGQLRAMKQMYRNTIQTFKETNPECRKIVYNPPSRTPEHISLPKERKPLHEMSNKELKDIIDIYVANTQIITKEMKTISTAIKDLKKQYPNCFYKTGDTPPRTVGCVGVTCDPFAGFRSLFSRTFTSKKHRRQDSDSIRSNDVKGGNRKRRHTMKKT